MTDIHNVLDFWFGELDERGVAADDAVRRWWQKSDAFDALIADRFGPVREAIMRGAHEDWLQSDAGTVAYIVTLDQFSRNLGRGTAVMFEADEQALAATRGALASGMHRRLGIDFTVALYMPLMHSEDLEDQDRCVELFAELAKAWPGIDRLASNVKYAVAHRDIIARFGRFPHRNVILGRESTPEEIEFLKQPGSSF